MKKNIKTIYILEVLMFIYIIIYKFIILDNFRQYLDIINIAFWVIIAIFMLIKFRYPRDKNYLKGSTIRLIIISLFSFLIFIYSLGIFTGFTKYVYAHDFFSIIKNTFPVLLIVVAQEIIRYIISRNSNNNIKPLIFLAFLYVNLNVMMEISYYNFNTAEQIFNFASTLCLPALAKQLLYSYITYKVSWIPTLLLRIANEIYVFVFPFYPRLSDYLIALTGVIYPYLIYVVLRKTIEYNEKSDLHIKKVFKNIILIPIVIATCIFVLLISGVLKYKLIAIGSNSMNPVYERGDAVIYQKRKSEDVIVGEILAFYRNGVVITHRVVSIKYNEGKYFFKTKGDNNKNIDQFTTDDTKVLGVVKYKIKYLGYPSIWLSESFKKD